ncbi:MAG: dihydroorotase [Chitinophagales bacterium]
MNILLENCTIFDSKSKHHLKKADVWIKNGKFEKIGKVKAADLPANTTKISNASISKGWTDLFAHFCDPGLEHKEDIHSGLEAAAIGGFTKVAVMPNTIPAIHSKSEVEYLLNKSAAHAVQILPYGAITRDCAGKDISEIYDMHHSGAVAFSDGVNSALDAGTTLRALLYVKAFNGLVITHPLDRSLANGGVMNEGTTSTLMGLKGIPAIAEEIIVKRDIQLAEYADSRLHFAYVSAAGSVGLIKAAKKRGVKVTCSVNACNLRYIDEELAGYESNWKIMPPLRTEQDQKALIKGVKEGVIDNISSFHIPQDQESKQKEFDYAEFGMLGLQSSFGIALEALKDEMELNDILKLFTENPARLLNLQLKNIEEGNNADITIFNTDEKQLISEEWIVSKSINTPFIGKELPLRVLGIVSRGKAALAKAALQKEN